ncbi:MAG: sigma-54-dependent Fis family transcriptional regulator [Myxococcales bacterium]|nr:sigma-54-dependent Fis family transcriptional regulator [Myxococcales bacterium]
MTLIEASALDIFGLALHELAGSALILDGSLRIVAKSPAAEILLGGEVQLGTDAPTRLCEPAKRADLAELFSIGRAFSSRLDSNAEASRPLSLSCLPLASGQARPAWLILLKEAAENRSDGPVEFHGMLTQDAATKGVFHIIERVARGETTVLLHGETGAGKELVAHALHALSPRRAGPFRALNCAAFPANLLESELFGHEKGAFTGAHKATLGHMQLADGGTLFLDEVAELPLELQAKLLRVVETRLVLPVGGRRPVPVDVRFVSATHRSLREEVEAGRFRADLMYRLRVIPIELPPLRDRKGDIRLLTESFIKRLNAQGERVVEHVANETWDVLEAWPFPGNVRELKNVLTYAYALGEGPLLRPTELPTELLEGRAEAVRAAASSTPSAESNDRRRITEALATASGRREAAASMLGLSRVTLWRRMKALGLT